MTAIARTTDGTIEVALIVKMPGNFWACRATNGTPLVVHESYLNMTIPHRYKESQFRRYAPYIVAALQAWPNVVRFKPTSVSMETFAARFRDARDAAIKFGYVFEGLDPAVLAKNGPELSVSMESDAIAIGPRDAIRQKNLVAEVVAPRASSAVEYEIEVHALPALCAVLPKIKPMPQFFVRTTDTSLLEKLESAFDVVFVPDATDKEKYILL